MIDALAPYLRRPCLWERSDALFWDDEHISKGMLEAHLNPKTDAASRRPEVIEKTVGWLSSYLPSGARLLDLGCGPGLYAKRLSAMGFHVTGMDCSRRSIDYARAHDGETEYICGDYLTLSAENVYDAVTLIYCDYAALTKPERVILLSNIRRALRPGGLFIFDVFAKKGEAAEETSWDRAEKGGFWSPEPYLCLNARYLYEGGFVSAQRHTVLTESGVRDYIIWDTVYTPSSLAEELAEGGFAVRALYGDTCGAPCGDQSETICCVAARAI